MLNRDEAVLVVVDVQEKLLPAIHDQEQMLRRTRLLIRGAGLLQLPILVTEQYPQGIGPTDAGIVKALGESYQPIQKASMSAMSEPAFLEALVASGRRQVILCGIEAHVCVYLTAQDMRADSRAVYVATDCISSRQERDYAIAVQRMEAIGCCLTTHEMAVFELLRQSGTSEFKQWIQMIR
ncbi:MAG: isochorismatase family protein [Candidatus Eisenbacteria sp.]|nr:isochorismatase family protein [Candidatus Eisenbacteria bacterium]